MSGRATFLRTDEHGHPERVTGYRKTQRRNPHRPRDGATPAHVAPELAAAFIVPATILLSAGAHGYGVTVTEAGTVRVAVKSFDRRQPFALAADFLQRVAPQGFEGTISAVLTSSSEPGWKDYFEMAMTNGSVVVSHTRQTPWIFSARR